MQPWEELGITQQEWDGIVAFAYDCLEKKKMVTHIDFGKAYAMHPLDAQRFMDALSRHTPMILGYMHKDA